QLKSDQYHEVTDRIKRVSSCRMIVDIPNIRHGLSPKQILQFAGNGRSRVHFCNATPGVDYDTLSKLWNRVGMGQVGQPGGVVSLKSVYFHEVPGGLARRLVESIGMEYIGEFGIDQHGVVHGMHPHFKRHHRGMNIKAHYTRSSLVFQTGLRLLMVSRAAIVSNASTSEVC
ncbi:hypothetical protein PMAYCL1PPCAC_32344, partial [Pristionchus mayeri]